MLASVHSSTALSGARHTRLSFARHRPLKVQVMGLFGMFGSAKAEEGCELAPKEAPPGLKLATFAGGW